MVEQPVSADNYRMDEDSQGAEEATWPGDFQALFGQLQHLMQQGTWQAAGETLAELEARFPADGRLPEARQLLGLRLSAEESWSGGKRPRTPTGLRVVRALLVANVLLYSLLLALYLLGKGAAF